MRIAALNIALLALVGLMSCTSPPVSPDPRTENEKTLYALGLATSQSLGALALNETNLEFIKAGVTDGVLKNPLRAGAVRTESGAFVITMKEGNGATPKAADTVKVHYHGTLIDGTVFDSSVKRGEPATFGLNQVIKCWTEGVQQIKLGGKSTLVCPSNIAYGNRGMPPTIGPGAILIFEVELLDIVRR